MSGMPTLSDAQLQFIERVGLYFEQYQVSRIGGRWLITNFVAGSTELAP